MRAAALLILALLLLTACRPELPRSEADPAPAQELPDYSECFAGLFEQRSLLFGSGDHLDGLLRRTGIEGGQRQEAEAALAQVWNLSRFRAGNRLNLVLDPGGNLLCLHYAVDYLRDLCLWREGGRYEAALYETKLAGEPFRAVAELEGSFYESFRTQGLDGSLATRVADLFAGEVDFFLDLRADDRMEILAERAQRGDRDGDRVRILAAYLHLDGEELAAYLHPDSLGERHYYHRDGGSLNRQFLRAPLEFTRISSGFNPRRMHPVLHRVRPHNGVDYAAPVGTPVVATADGRVSARGRQKQAGRYLKLRHAGGIETTYMHLSRFAGGTSQGSRVRQGQVIGYVGSSGLSTGPHLDYRMKVSGKYIDPRRFRSAPSSPLPDSEREAFDASLARYDTLRKTFLDEETALPPFVSAETSQTSE